MVKLDPGPGLLGYMAFLDSFTQYTHTLMSHSAKTMLGFEDTIESKSDKRPNYSL